MSNRSMQLCIISRTCDIAVDIRNGPNIVDISDTIPYGDVPLIHVAFKHSYAQPREAAHFLSYFFIGCTSEIHANQLIGKCPPEAEVSHLNPECPGETTLYSELWGTR